ncbi:hypothetical protein A3K86_14425 [Photobacterium jeanii]|uniref:Spondin domain-containing protein n=1 Tax=Photobacterium jeanii TaxID=858640 RepID=A0A178KAT4_9GAMM|nr:spondin domain-containing protein [Photobacterium jeanii]OAN13753.1 hypothetical protein A3K86_14425 [Photobacterium jeanii]PST88874.1 hypothetical protein C9I91_16290 [Photobacterium jeanii]
MNVFKLIVLSFFAFILSACGGSDGDDNPSPVVPDSDAVYELTFTTNWNAANFPTNFPNDRHFSGLIGLTHNSDIKLYEVGQLASPGVVSMAETGSKTILKTEIEEQQNKGNAHSTIDGNGVPASSTSVTVTFNISQEHPLATVVTMIAPSPDWFTGVNSVPLFTNGQWVDETELDAISYDAGSDSGTVFNSANLVTSPQEPITRLSTDRADTDFDNGINASNSLPIGSFKFKRIK